MDLKNRIKDEFGSQYQFSKQNNIPQANVSYWCNRDWLDLTRKTRKKILALLGETKTFYCQLEGCETQCGNCIPIEKQMNK